MRLLSCHINNFGKLSDFSCRFEEDLHVLFAENGWGKSTLAAFLKVMFYGFEGENKRTEDSNERLRYRPWQGGVYGGSVTFSCGGHSYRMIRVFGSRKKDDTFRLFDGDTGLASSAYSDRIGEELFSIDRESFSRTVFWSQKDHETAATTSIQAKIGDLAREQGDLPSYDPAVRRIRKEMERLRPDRASGLIRKREERIRAMEADEARLPLLTARLEHQTHEEAELTGLLERIRADRQQYSLQSAPAADTYSSYIESINAANSELQSLNSRAAAAGDRIKMLDRIRHSTLLRGRRTKKEFSLVQNDLRQEEQDLSERRQQIVSSLRAASAICFAAALVTLILFLAKILPAPSGILAPLSAAAGIAAYLGSLHPETFIPDTPELERLQSEKHKLRASLRTLRRRLFKANEQIEDERRLCHELQRRTNEKKKELRRLTDAAEADRHISTPQTDALPQEISRTLSDYDEKEEHCRLQLQELQKQSESLRSEIRECTQSKELLPALREEAAALREQYDTCSSTLRYLEEARNSFTSRYMNPFLRSFGRYYSMLTGESPESLQTDADFSIKVMSGGLPRDPSLMSEGTRDLISLCRRMAMIDAMYPGEKPFLVLDDPFANLDDERVKGGLRFLRSASREYQILYLTCHKSRV